MKRTSIGSGLFVLSLACTGEAATSRPEFFASYCQVLQPCCSLAHLPADPQSCRATLETLVPRAGFDAEAAASCLAALQAASGRPEFCQNTDPDQHACDRVFGRTLPAATGNRQPGERCQFTDECAPSDDGPVLCQQEYGEKRRTRACQVQVRGQAGDSPCLSLPDPLGSFPYPDQFIYFSVAYRRSVAPPRPLGPPPPRLYQCHQADGLRCEDESERCVPLIRVGEECANGGTCVPGAFCEVATRKCRARQPVGAACNPGVFWDSPCEPGSFCDADSRSCQPQVAVAAPCTQDTQCRTGVCVNDRCASSDLADLGASLVCR